MNKCVLFTGVALAGGMLALAACSKHETVENRNMTPAQVSALQAASARRAARMASVSAPAMASQPGTVGAAGPMNTLPNIDHIAHFYPLNTGVTGLNTGGEARFAISGDELTIWVDVTGAPPGIMHWQHIHGFANGGDAVCASGTSDVNGDGIVDIVETEAVSGITMVPFDVNPVELEIVTDTYPTASADGSYHYRRTISLETLQSAFAEAYDGQELELSKYVVYIHGVPADTELPDSVASIADIPAQTTLPIACAEIVAVPADRTDVMMGTAPSPATAAATAPVPASG